MRDADRTIERLLAGLRDAEPPAAMEPRILEALDDGGSRGGSLRVALAPAVASGACHAVGVCSDPGDHRFYCSTRKHVPGSRALPLQPKEGLNGAPNLFIPTVGQKPSPHRWIEAHRPRDRGVPERPQVRLQCGRRRLPASLHRLCR